MLPVFLIGLSVALAIRASIGKLRDEITPPNLEALGSAQASGEGRWFRYPANPRGTVDPVVFVPTSPASGPRAEPGARMPPSVTARDFSAQIAAQDPAARSGSPRVFYRAADWSPYLAPLLAAANEPPAFAAKWLTVESDFQPCAVGGVFASFVWPADGKTYPLEAGIAQLYGPDDYTLLGVQPSAFRAYAAPDYVAVYVDAKGVTRSALAHSQVCVRSLTPDEMHVQAKATVDKITSARHAADRLLAAAGATWSPTSADYWAFVKLQHALPGLAKAIGYVRANLGRAPTSWAEFAATVLTPATLSQIKAHDPGTWAHQAGFANDLHNAWETGAVVSGPPVV